MSNEIVKGSVAAIAKQENISVAEGFLRVKLVVLIDVSGSMDAHDAIGSKSRFDVAVKELKSLQKDNHGLVAVISFSDDARFVPGGVPSFEGQSTALNKALNLAKPLDGMVDLVVISDGEPDDPELCLTIAKTMKSAISCIYVGSEKSRTGRHFLEKLSAACHGRMVVMPACNGLGQAIQRFLPTPATEG